MPLEGGTWTWGRVPLGKPFISLISSDGAGDKLGHLEGWWGPTETRACWLGCSRWAEGAGGRSTLDPLLCPGKGRGRLWAGLPGEASFHWLLLDLFLKVLSRASTAHLFRLLKRTIHGRMDLGRPRSPPCPHRAPGAVPQATSGFWNLSRAPPSSVCYISVLTPVGR